VSDWRSDEFRSREISRRSRRGRYHVYSLGKKVFTQMHFAALSSHRTHSVFYPYSVYAHTQAHARNPIQKGIIVTFPVSTPSLAVSPLFNHTSPPSPSYTKCPGNKKFATPSFTAYSCPHAPHTNFPSCIQVSSSTRCRSCAVWLGVSSEGSTVSVVVVSSAEFEASMRSAGVGAVGGRVGRPSCGSWR
jgi:hypothetical protein